MNRIWQVRQQLGVSQGELAEASGVTQVHISTLESGRRGDPGVQVAWRLLRGLRRLGARVAFEDVFPPPEEIDSA